MLRGSVRRARDWLYYACMKAGEPQLIVPLSEHEALAELQAYDFPAESMTKARVILAAKAWIEDDLACFFADPESTKRFVIIFKSYRSFMPAIGVDDMRNAEIGALYRLDVFVSDGHLPVVDRVERAHISK